MISSAGVDANISYLYSYRSWCEWTLSQVFNPISLLIVSILTFSSISLSSFAVKKVWMNRGFDQSEQVKILAEGYADLMFMA